MAMSSSESPGGSLPGQLWSRLRSNHPIVSQLIRFALVSGLATAINTVVFLIARTWWDAIPANLLGLVVSTAIGTEINRRFTFEAGRTHRWRAHVQTAGTVLFYAFYSSGVLLVVNAMITNAAPWQETLAVVLTGMVSGLVRFVLLRTWVFATRADRPRDVPSGRNRAPLAR